MNTCLKRVWPHSFLVAFYIVNKELERKGANWFLMKINENEASKINGIFLGMKVFCSEDIEKEIQTRSPFPRFCLPTKLRVDLSLGPEGIFPWSAHFFLDYRRLGTRNRTINLFFFSKRQKSRKVQRSDISQRMFGENCRKQKATKQRCFSFLHQSHELDWRPGKNFQVFFSHESLFGIRRKKFFNALCQLSLKKWFGSLKIFFSG